MQLQSRVDIHKYWYIRISIKYSFTSHENFYALSHSYTSIELYYIATRTDYGTMHAYTDIIKLPDYPGLHAVCVEKLQVKLLLYSSFSFHHKLQCNANQVKRRSTDFCCVQHSKHSIIDFKILNLLIYAY